MPAPARPLAVLILLAALAACAPPPPAPAGDAIPPGPDAIEGDY